MSDAFISETLVHWVGRKKNEEAAFHILETICNELQLKLSYCPTYMATTLSARTSMVCFTDIPFGLSKKHCLAFGNFGIGFHKKPLLEYGANPVFYTTGKHFKQIKSISGLLAKMVELEKDREWQEQYQEYHFSEEETFALYDILGFLQEYSYKSNDFGPSINYYQREWRLTFDSLPLQKNNIRLPGHKTLTKNGRFVNFDKADVHSLIVPRLFGPRAQPLASSIGCDLLIYEEVVHS